MNHVVLFSGGVGSWAAAKRVAEQYGTENLTLLYTDTRSEDEDLYRFLIEAAANVYGIPEPNVTRALKLLAKLPGLEDNLPAARSYLLNKAVKLTRRAIPGLRWIADGRDVWEIFEFRGFIGNTRADPCSQILKRRLARKYINNNFGADDTVVYVGIDWSEQHRFERMGAHWAPFRVAAPMIGAPYLTRADVLEWLRSEGVAAPRLYEMGFKHNNCGGFCVKGGQGQFAHLLRVMPKRYRYHEQKELEHRERAGKDVSILRDRIGGPTKPLTLRALRERSEAAQQPIDHLDWGACACIDPSDEELDEPMGGA